MTDVPLLETMQRKGSALLPLGFFLRCTPSHLRVSLISRYITGRMDGRPSSRKVGRMEDGGDSGKGRATTLSLVASSRYGLYILSDFLPSSNNECSRHHAPNRVTVPRSPIPPLGVILRLPERSCGQRAAEGAGLDGCRHNCSEHANYPSFPSL